MYRTYVKCCLRSDSPPRLAAACQLSMSGEEAKANNRGALSWAIFLGGLCFLQPHGHANTDYWNERWSVSFLIINGLLVYWTIKQEVRR